MNFKTEREWIIHEMGLTKRIIGVVMVENGKVVRRVGWKTQAIVSDPQTTIKYLQDWNVDEIAFINVGKNDLILDVLQYATEGCFIPISIGGNIRTYSQVCQYIKNGADKVILGRFATEDLCTKISRTFGAQSQIVSVDEHHENRIPEITQWPIGEIIYHDKTRDGQGKGLNLDILDIPCPTPKIAMGGVGCYQDVVDGLQKADAVAIGNLMHFKEITATQAKKKAIKEGMEIRR